MSSAYLLGGDGGGVGAWRKGNQRRLTEDDNEKRGLKFLSEECTESTSDGSAVKGRAATAATLVFSCGCGG